MTIVIVIVLSNLWICFLGNARRENSSRQLPAKLCSLQYYRKKNLLIFLSNKTSKLLSPSVKSYYCQSLSEETLSSDRIKPELFSFLKHKTVYTHIETLSKVIRIFFFPCFFLQDMCYNKSKQVSLLFTMSCTKQYCVFRSFLQLVTLWLGFLKESY